MADNDNFSPLEDVLPIQVRIDEPTWPFARVIDAQFMDLDGFVESSTPEYTSLNVIGRMEQIKTYAGTTNREVTLQFIYRANTEKENTTILRMARTFDALKYPYYDDAGENYYPPPPVMLIIGSFLNMRAVVSACEVRWIGPFNPFTAEPRGADITATFTSVQAASFRRINVNGPDRYRLDGGAPARSSGVSYLGGVPANVSFSEVSTSRTQTSYTPPTAEGAALRRLMEQ